jgi:hypothetical protein
LDLACGLESNGSGWELVAGSCEYDNESSDSTKCMNFLDQRSDYQLPKKKFCTMKLFSININVCFTYSLHIIMRIIPTYTTNRKLWQTIIQQCPAKLQIIFSICLRIKNIQYKNFSVVVHLPLLYFILDDQEFRIPVLVRSRIFCSPLQPDQLWGPPSLISSGYWGLFLQG